MPTVSISDKNQEINLKKDEIIFDGLDNQGIQLPHGCLSGSCGACRIEILEGNQYLSTPSAMEQNTIDAISSNYERINGLGSLGDKTIRLSCRAKISGDGKVTIKPMD